MLLRAVGLSGLAFALVTSSVLSAVVIRSPGTHDHIARSLRSDYARTPLDSMGASDLSAILADLPEFSFPEPPMTASSPGLTEGSEAHTVNGVGDSAGPKPSEPIVITLKEFEYGFDMDRIDLQVGVPVELTVINEGDQVHGIWVPDFAIMEDIRSGKSMVFTFTPEKSGRFRFTCSYNLCGTEEEHAQMKGFFVAK